MAFNIWVLIVLMLPGVLGEYYYRFCMEKEINMFFSLARVMSISVLSFFVRCLVSVLQGYGNSHLLIFFDNPDNFVKYIIISLISAFLLTNIFIFLELSVMTKLKKKLS